MSDNAIQVSFKKPDGTIYVVGGADVDAFALNLVALFSGDREVPDTIMEDMCRSLTPMGGDGASAGFYTPHQPQPGQPYQAGGRIAQVPTAVKIPWADKAQADAFLAPLKASRQATWDPTGKVWMIQPGVDLTPFLRWLPPGS